MKVSREAWNLKAESFGPLLPYVIDPDITDINFNGTDVWVEHLKRGIYKVPVQLPAEFVSQFSIRVSNGLAARLISIIMFLKRRQISFAFRLFTPVLRTQAMQYLSERRLR